MIGYDELRLVESNMSSQKEYNSIRNWLTENEPNLVEWAAESGRKQMSSIVVNGITIPPPFSDMIEYRFATCIFTGYMVAMLHNMRINSNEVDIEEYKVMYNNQPGAMWKAWISGDLPDKYYDTEFVSDTLDTRYLGKTWEEAVANHNAKVEKLKETQSHIAMVKLTSNSNDVINTKPQVDI